jgi:hypothetical protein
MTNPLNWHKQPDAIALFDKAWAIVEDNPNADFPFDIDDELEALCDEAWLSGGMCVVTAWDAYCADKEGRI